MAHARQQIRDAAVAAIEAANTKADSAVYSGHVYPMDILPAINVTTPKRVDISADADGASMTEAQYDLTLRVQIHVAKRADLDDEIDDLAAEVETALHGDTELAALVFNLELEEDETELADEAAKPHGLHTMTWTCNYIGTRGDPESIIS